MAVTLPPYLNRAEAAGSRVKVVIGHDPLSLKIVPQDVGGVELDTLRQKLMAAYVRQLASTARHEVQDGGAGAGVFAGAPGERQAVGKRWGRPSGPPSSICCGKFAAAN